MKKHDIWLDCGAGTMFKLSEVTAVSRVALFDLESTLIMSTHIAA